MQMLKAFRVRNCLLHRMWRSHQYFFKLRVWARVRDIYIYIERERESYLFTSVIDTKTCMFLHLALSQTTDYEREKEREVVCV